MSGPFDRPDDPDEVTLWAGRLRAWPANPPAPADDDATASTVADDLDDATVRSDAREPDDATVIARRADAVEEPDDATVIVRRVDAVEAPDDRTMTARGADLEAPPPDDATVVSVPPRSGDGSDAAASTVQRRPSGPASPIDDETVRRAPLNDETVRRAPVDDRTSVRAEALPDDTAPGRRATRSPAPVIGEPADDSTQPRRSPRGADDTHAGSRRARRAEAATDASPNRRSPDAGAAVREARVPAALQREAYDPRVDAPIRVERSVVPARPEPGRDPALVRPRTARRGAWRALLIGAAVVLLLAAAAAAAVLMLG
ncbi:hypothetical protein RWH44_03610 [Microbacterium sp. KSW2-29]|uniref:Uncharacterized protein n=1 Tax=Microbacterium phycohabitans TaxID=3075993 RepID=A0ABU3SJJ5_9MICO|nr:hypothetical protein [Microbacterium sp. KSW2-29]MDU0344786.1 hypothetical protein [Microbacterium sp. KSW2-29]